MQKSITLDELGSAELARVILNVAGKLSNRWVSARKITSEVRNVYSYRGFDIVADNNLVQHIGYILKDNNLITHKKRTTTGMKYFLK